MALSALKRKILNDIINYLPSHRKGQISPTDGGDVKLGDMLGCLRVQSAELATITANPTAVTDANAAAGDTVAVLLQSDDTGGALGLVTGSASAGAVSLDPENAPTNNDGIVLYIVLRPQS